MSKSSCWVLDGSVVAPGEIITGWCWVWEELEFARNEFIPEARS